MWASKQLTNLCLTDRTTFSASWTSSWQQLFGARYEIRSRNLKGISKLKNCRKRGAVLAAFQQAYVFRVIATLKRELLLREVSLLSHLTEHARKSSLLRRTLFVSKWHSQPGVWGVSADSSTNYTFPLRNGGKLQISVLFHRKEAA
jgi:hypothetical protein